MNNTNSNTFKDLMIAVNEEHDALEAQEQAELQSIADTAPTISSSAMMVVKTIGVWEGRKKDKKASEDVATQNNAKRTVASVNKSLMGDCELLKAIKTHRGVVNNHIHYNHTLPWIHNGPALLTTTAYFKYKPLMDEAEQEFWRLVNEFVANYHDNVVKAQAELGDLFNPNDYPTEEEIRAKFKFSVEYIPLPESGDFRLDLAQETVDHLREGYEHHYAVKFQAAMGDVWKRLMDPLSNMVEKLDYSDSETKKIFKGTLVDNVLQIVDLMGAANITGDDTMTRIENELRSALEGVTPEALREDGALRAHTRKVAVEALKETKKQIDNLPSIW